MGKIRFDSCWNMGQMVSKTCKNTRIELYGKDHEGKSHWFDLVKGQWIQGLIAVEKQEQRLYVVTIEPELEHSIHDRWPRVMSG